MSGRRVQTLRGGSRSGGPGGISWGVFGGVPTLTSGAALVAALGRDEQARAVYRRVLADHGGPLPPELAAALNWIAGPLAAGDGHVDTADKPDASLASIDGGATSIPPAKPLPANGQGPTQGQAPAGNGQARDSAGGGDGGRKPKRSKVVRNPDYATVREAAALLGGVSQDMVYRLFNRGVLAGLKVGGCVRIERAGIERYLAGGGGGAGPAPARPAPGARPPTGRRRAAERCDSLPDGFHHFPRRPAP